MLYNRKTLFPISPIPWLPWIKYNAITWLSFHNKTKFTYYWSIQSFYLHCQGWCFYPTLIILFTITVKYLADICNEEIMWLTCYTRKDIWTWGHTFALHRYSNKDECMSDHFNLLRLRYNTLFSLSDWVMCLSFISFQHLYSWSYCSTSLLLHFHLSRHEKALYFC